MRYRLCPQVAWVNDECGAAVSVLRLPETSPLAFTGTAAEIFLDIAAGADLPASARERWGFDAADFETMIKPFLDELLTRRIIEEDSSSGCRTIPDGDAHE